MKKLFRNALMLTAAVGTLFFTACDGDEDILPTGPSVTFTTTPDLNEDGELELTVGQDYSITVNAITPGGFNTIRLTSGGTEVVQTRTDLGLDATATNASATFEFEGFSSAGTASIQIEVVDEANGTATETLDIIVNSPNIMFYEQVLFGAQGSSEPSFYNALENQRLGFAAARDASGAEGSTVDFAYYFGSNNQNTIASIDSDGLNAAFVATNPNLSIANTFATRNSTRFRVTDLSPDDFGAIMNEANLISEADSELNTNVAATNLSVGSVVAFKLDSDRGGYVGLIHVIEIDDTNGNGTITIEVKVQAVGE